MKKIELEIVALSHSITQTHSYAVVLGEVNGLRHLKQIIICDLQEGIFYSKLVCISEHDTVEIDSRTSDALALAVRFGCPIYTYENILESAGILMEDSSGKKKQTKETVTTELGGHDDLKSLSLEELNSLLNEVLEQEDYIRAIKIRDEINSRKKGR